MGYDPLPPVATGAEAIHISREALPDIILMDIQLADNIDGSEAAKQILSFEGPRHPAIIFMTGYSLSDLTHRLAGITHTGIMGKPVDLSRLKKMIESS
jgi:CheY-like chemotaxis protein